jgi:hypothetical protein
MAISRVVDLLAQSQLRSTKLIHFCSFKLIHLTKTELEGIFFSNRQSPILMHGSRCQSYPVAVNVWRLIYDSGDGNGCLLYRSPTLIHFCSFKLIQLTKTGWEGIVFSNLQSPIPIH